MKEMTIQDVQQVSLDILKDVHEFCSENKIKYTLFGGTLIGAIRHQGFIPWDDDVDIALPRAEYEKFINSYQSKKGYKLYAREIQGKNVLLSYARICEMDKTYVDDSSFSWNKEKKGVWIDVFPLDGMESDYEDALKRMMKVYKIWRLTLKIRYWSQPMRLRKGIIKKVKAVLEKLLLLLPHSFLWDKHIRICKEIQFENAKYYSNLSWAGFGMREYYKTSAFSDYVLVPFEDGFFYAMHDYDGALRAKYGDYMKLPPKNEQISRHSKNYYYWKD